MKITKELSPLQETVLQAFAAKDKDIAISAIYLKAYGNAEWRKKGTTVRTMQQKLGPTFAAINDKLEGAKIKPGKLKGTYRLDTKGE